MNATGTVRGIFCLIGIFAAMTSFNACSQSVSGGEDAATVDTGFCNTSDQCPWGSICTKNQCVTEPSCKSKLDCRAGEDCVGGRCQLETPDGGDDGATDGDLPDAGYCMNDDQCGYGNRCNMSTHKCEEAAIIKAQPPEADFGSVQWNQTVTKSIVITNIGKKSLDVTSTSFESGTSAQFKIVSGGAPFTLGESQYQTIVLSYTQIGAAIETGALLVTSTDTEVPLLRIPVFTTYKGTPYFSIVDKTKSPPQKLYPTGTVTYEYAFDMGSTNLTTPITKTLTIMNMSEGAILELKSVTLDKETDGVYSYKFQDTLSPLIDLALPIFISPAQMVDMIVTYTPNALSIKKFEIKDAIIKTNDNDISHTGNPGNDSLTVHMKVDLGSSKIGLSKTSITFPDTIVGKSEQDVVRVTNIGQSALFFKEGTGLETADGAYTINPSTYTLPLLPSQYIDVQTTFAPPDFKSYPNNIIFNTDDPDSPTVLVALSGKGISSTGAPCEYDNDCLQGNLCRQKKCCTTDCDGICASCAVEEHFGICTPLPKTTECLPKYCEGRYVHKAKLCNGQDPVKCEDNGTEDCFPKNCVTTPEVSCPDHTTCNNPGDPCAVGAACCSGNCKDISTYANTCPSAVEIKHNPGEAKCATALFCQAGGGFTFNDSHTGSRSMWFQGKATWNSGCPCTTPLVCDPYIINHHQIIFTAPVGAYYKIRLYYGNPGFNGCTAPPTNETLVGDGQQRTMEVSRKVYASDADKTMDYWVEIVYDSGATCGGWTLETDWSTCF